MRDEQTRSVISEFLSAQERKVSDISTAKDSHFLIRIIQTEDSFHLYSVTEKINGVPARVYNRAKGRKKQYWPTVTCYADSELLIYKTVIPASELSPGARFFVERNKNWHRIFNPYHADLNLPEGWGFSPYHLYATYQADEELKEHRQRAFIRTIACADNTLVIEGALICNYDPTGAVLTIRKFRDGRFSWNFPLQVTPAHRVWGKIGEAYAAYRGERAYKFKCIVNLPWNELISSIYTAIVHVGERSTGLFPFNRTFSNKNGLFELNKRTVHAYMDVVANNVRIDVYDFDNAFVKKMLKQLPVIQDSSTAPVCLVGEYTNAARDNGLRLFQANRASAEIDYWYVGEEECGVAGAKFTKFGSKEHFELALKAKCVAFTHHPNYVMPILPWVKRGAEGPKTLFLQHGVTALKNSMPSYHSGKRRFDAFAVCSEREKVSVAEACDYFADHVHVVGMPRLDNLRLMAEQTIDHRETVIIFPTWRRGLDKMNGTEFVGTNFFAMWSNAMQSIKDACQLNDKKAVLVSHPIIGHHVEYFREFVDEIIDIEKIQEALCSAYMLFTDYSSICFDAVYIDVPVVFFTFDQDDYGFQEGAFIDVNSELPGAHCFTIKELNQHLTDIKAFAKSARELANSKMSMFFKEVDKKNCERIHNLILKLSSDEKDRELSVAASSSPINDTYYA